MTELPVINRQEFGFQRTTCDCAECSINCQYLPGYLVPADLERIAAQIGAECLMEFASANLLASPGATVMVNGQVRQIPTLVPARRMDGACKFLDGDNRCTIHNVSPFGCAFFDAHQPREESDYKSMHGLHAIEQDWQDGGKYGLIWLMLEKSGRTAPTPAEARAKLKAAWERQQQERSQF